MPTLDRPVCPGSFSEFRFGARSKETHTGFQGWGPRLGVTIDPDQVHFGFHADFGSFAGRLRFHSNFELGLGDDFTIATVSFEINYRFRNQWDVWSPYLGVGLGILFIDHDTRGRGDGTGTELGASVLGGIEKGISNGDRFFLEMKLGLVDAPDLKLTVGWTFGH